MPAVLFDIGHPAHVHLFKNPRKILLERGWKVFVLARDKEVTRSLLDDYEIEYIPGTKKRSGLLSVLEFFQWFAKARKVIREHGIDMVASIGSPSGAWAAKLSGIVHIAFNDTETALSQRLLYKPASVSIHTPSCLLADYGLKQVRYKGTHDLAYLRPEWFSPDRTIVNTLGLSAGEPYVLLRFVSWEASHDWGERPMGIDFKREIAGIASQSHRLFISAEGYLPDDLERYRLRIRPSLLHHVMACAAAVVGDGSTTMTEAACLGVPALYISPFASSFGVVEFYRHYGLISSSRSEPEALDMLRKILKEPEMDRREKMKARMLSETIDVAIYIADQCEAALSTHCLGLQTE